MAPLRLVGDHQPLLPEKPSQISAFKFEPRPKAPLHDKLIWLRKNKENIITFFVALAYVWTCIGEIILKRNFMSNKTFPYPSFLLLLNQGSMAVCMLILFYIAPALFSNVRRKLFPTVRRFQMDEGQSLSKLFMWYVEIVEKQQENIFFLVLEKLFSIKFANFVSFFKNLFSKVPHAHRILLHNA